MIVEKIDQNTVKGSALLLCFVAENIIFFCLNCLDNCFSTHRPSILHSVLYIAYPNWTNITVIPMLIYVLPLTWETIAPFFLINMSFLVDSFNICSVRSFFFHQVEWKLNKRQFTGHIFYSRFNVLGSHINLWFVTEKFSSFVLH